MGVYIKLTDPPNNGTLEFWPYETVGEWDFFNPQSFYQLILVRNDEGLINIYVNGEEFTEYDDSESQAYVPQDPNHYIVFFRDSPSVLANEASPGFVSAIHIMNAAWTPAEVENYWSLFCSSLLDIKESTQSGISLYPVPAEKYLQLEVSLNPEGTIRILDLTGRALINLPLSEKQTNIDISPLNRGLYIIEVQQQGQTWYSKFMKK